MKIIKIESNGKLAVLLEIISTFKLYKSQLLKKYLTFDNIREIFLIAIDVRIFD